MQPPPAPAHGDHEVIIVGAGIIGASTAYHLAKLGVRSLVLEQCAVACAASGKAGGFLAKDWCDGSPLRALARTSFPMHADFEQELGVPLGYRALDAYSVSLVHRTSPTAAYQSRPRLRSPASALSWINDGDMALARTPRRIGSTATTAQIHPRKLTEALLAGAERLAGAQIRFCKVVDVKRAADISGIEVSVRDRGSDGGAISVLRCSKLVLAMGPWSVHAQRWFPQLPAVMAQKSVSVVVPEVLPPQALFSEYVDSSGGPSSPEVYPRSDETYICCSARQEELPEDPAAIVADAADVRGLTAFAGAMSARLRAATAHADTFVAQACNLPLSPDGVPVIGPVPGAESVFIATGHSCWGILNAPATGQALAELVAMGYAQCVDLRPFSPARFGAKG